jgi:transketolase
MSPGRSDEGRDLVSPDMARTMRRWIVEQSLGSRVGHVGSALSIVDIVAALWGGLMRWPGTENPERDRFILGKGHAALALYAALRFQGLLGEDGFRSYCQDDSLLNVHPERELDGVDASTGSLGQGLSLGCGIALGLRLKGLGGRVFVVLSDAECNEGQVWEAAFFAAHHKLAAVQAVVDVNGLQALGHTKDVLDIADLGGLWRAAGWDVESVDGHDQGALQSALGPRPDVTAPRVVLAQTVLGKGVSFMEGRLEWHYRNLTPELAAQALAEIGGER